MQEYCISIFRDGKKQTTSDAYTAAWARLINLLEKSKE